MYILRNSIDGNNICGSNFVPSISAKDGESSKDAQVYSKLIFSFDNEKGLSIEADSVRLKTVFSCLLSGSTISDDLTKFLDEICVYYFDLAVKFYINMSESRRELRRRSGHVVQTAKNNAKAKNTTAVKILSQSKNFVFYLKSVETVHRTNEFVSIKFDSFVSDNSSDRILLVRDKDWICVEPGNRGFYMYISKSFAFRALEQFEFTNIIDVTELTFIAENYLSTTTFSTEY